MALVLCLNIGVDPPGVVRTKPCATLECWADPLALPMNKGLATIGKKLQSQVRGAMMLEHRSIAA